jgi:Arc/MetJ-type ribon-helix-helix transcriptional regulator
MVKRIKVPVSQLLIKKIQKEIEKSKGEFSDVTEFIEFVLRELFEEEYIDTYTKEEEKIIKDRLKSLGYIE